VKVIKAGQGTLESCTKCHGLVKPVAKKVAATLDLRDLLKRPFGWEGIFTAIGLAFGFWLAWLPMLGPVFKYASMAALIATYFSIIDYVGSNKPGMPGALDTVEDLGSIVSTILRGAFCLLLGSAPMLVWVHVLRHSEVPLGLSDAPVLLGLACVGLLYMPAVLMAIVITGTTKAAFWPPAWIRIAGRAPLSYLTLVGTFILAVLALGVWQLLVGNAIGWLPIVGPMVVATGTHLLLFVQACLVGGFLRRHAALFGWD
jgi:hypothetical protein